MADYYPLIARAIAGLDPNAPGESRRALYERARGAPNQHLRSVRPPPRRASRPGAPGADRPPPGSPRPRPPAPPSSRDQRQDDRPQRNLRVDAPPPIAPRPQPPQPQASMQDPQLTPGRGKPRRGPGNDAPPAAPRARRRRR